MFETHGILALIAHRMLEKYKRMAVEDSNHDGTHAKFSLPYYPLGKVTNSKDSSIAHQYVFGIVLSKKGQLVILNPHSGISVDDKYNICDPGFNISDVFSSCDAHVIKHIRITYKVPQGTPIDNQMLE